MHRRAANRLALHSDAQLHFAAFTDLLTSPAVTDILADLRGTSGEAPRPGAGRRKQRPGERARAEQFADVPPEELGKLFLRS